MGRILKSYLFWTYPRGSFHYDVMVTLILAFIFLSPLVIDYQERPQETPTLASSIGVEPLGGNRLAYRIGAGQIADRKDSAAVRAELLERIQAVSGNVHLDSYREQKDAGGHIAEYRVWAHR